MTGLLLAALALAAQQDPTRATIAALPPGETRGRGAALPFLTLEAEDGVHNGETLRPTREFGELAAEASGRRAVRLTRQQGVGFLLPAPADAITIRYALPDSADGRGIDSMLGVYADGQRIGELELTSRYSWYYGTYPFTNRPADGRAHHLYDHARLRLDRTLPAGTLLSLRREGGDKAEWTVIDLADIEQVPPPVPMPVGALPVTRFGADPTGRRSSIAAFRAAIARGRKARRPVWVPPGSYRIDGHLVLDRVTLQGAGHWYSMLRGNGIGLFGAHSRGVRLSGVAILGEVVRRIDKAQTQGVGGAFSDSTIADLWIQHTKVGLWLDGPMDRLSVRRVRVYDQAADGVNFHGGVTNSVVEDSFFRGLGDDGLAMWSHRSENRDDAFRRNTVIAPSLANGIALYGGRDIAVEDNLVADTLTQGGGLHLGARFNATPFAGTIRLRGNMAVRTGWIDPNWKFGIGALWFHALERAMTGARFDIADTVLLDNGQEAVQFLGKPIRGVTIRGLAIRTAGGPAFQLQAPGEANVRDTVARGLDGAGVAADGQGFVLVDAGGNHGWERRVPFEP